MTLSLTGTMEISQTMHYMDKERKFWSTALKIFLIAHLNLFYLVIYPIILHNYDYFPCQHRKLECKLSHNYPKTWNFHHTEFAGIALSPVLKICPETEHCPYTGD